MRNFQFFKSGAIRTVSGGGIVWNGKLGAIRVQLCHRKHFYLSQIEIRGKYEEKLSISAGIVAFRKFIGPCGRFEAVAADRSGRKDMENGRKSEACVNFSTRKVNGMKEKKKIVDNGSWSLSCSLHGYGGRKHPQPEYLIFAAFFSLAADANAVGHWQQSHLSTVVRWKALFPKWIAFSDGRKNFFNFLVNEMISTEWRNARNCS